MIGAQAAKDESGQAPANAPEESAVLLDGKADVSPASSGGTIDGAVRSYLMATANVGELSDWVSWANGASLGWQSSRFAGFGVGARFYATVATAGNATALDPTTGRPSRYELGLYDVVAKERADTALLGEAYLDFAASGHHVWLGRHRLKSPLINPQDGRMIPSLVQGVWYEGSFDRRLKLQLGYLSHVAPRSTGGFYSAADSIGLYPSGRSVIGQPSAYAGRLESAGVFVGSAAYRTPLFRAQAWDYLVENIFNTVYLEVGVRPKDRHLGYIVDAQVLAQQRLGQGGSDGFNQRPVVDRQLVSLCDWSDPGSEADGETVG